MQDYVLSLISISFDIISNNVGKYYVNSYGLSAFNYNIVNIAGLVTIAPAPIVVRADNNIMIYNKTIYTPTYTIYGLQNNDTLSGNLIFTGTYQTNYNTGTYTIIPSGLTSTNYLIKYINGTLTIKKAPLLHKTKASPEFIRGLAHQLSCKLIFKKVQ